MKEVQSMGDWPYLRLALPEGASEDDQLQLVQAAVDAGALGGQFDACKLLIYLPREADGNPVPPVEQAIRETLASLDLREMPIEALQLADAPWATAWKADFKTLEVGQRLMVRPDWESSTPPPPGLESRIAVYIRPGAGFGTARHETTRLALELLELHLKPGGSVLDFGSGSGILAIAAIRLGARHVTAIEFDEQANQNARENYVLNNAADFIHLVESDQLPGFDAGLDTIVCNMLPHEARPHFGRLAALLAPGGESRLIYSGLLADQKEEIENDLRQVGLETLDYRQAGEWGAFVAWGAERPGGA